MTAPAAEERPSEWQLPDLHALTNWQRDGLACADCGRSLLFITCAHAGTLHDADDWTYEIYLCELCALRLARNQPPPTATEPTDDP